MTLASYLTDAPWKARAACRDLDNSIFFPDRGAPSNKRARRVCAGCVVQVDCLEEALSFGAHYDYGIWGGTNAHERRMLRRERAA